MLHGQSSDNAISAHLDFLYKCLCYCTGVELKLEPVKPHGTLWIPHSECYPVLGIHRLEVKLSAALILLRMACPPVRRIRRICGGTPRIARPVNVLLPQ